MAVCSIALRRRRECLAAVFHLLLASFSLATIPPTSPAKMLASPKTSVTNPEDVLLEKFRTTSSSQAQEIRKLVSEHLPDEVLLKTRELEDAALKTKKLEAEHEATKKKERQYKAISPLLQSSNCLRMFMSPFSRLAQPLRV